MDYALFEERLLYTLAGRSTVIITVFILIAISLLVELIHFWKTKTNQAIIIWNFLLKKRKISIKKTAKQQMIQDIVCIAILSTILVYSVFPTYRDITNQQYVKIETEYSRNERHSDGNLFSYGHVYIKTGDKTITLNLPRNWTAAEFPEGTHYGTIWYSEESMVILAFIPQ